MQLARDRQKGLHNVDWTEEMMTTSYMTVNSTKGSMAIQFEWKNNNTIF